ncbi:MAG TPA: hypothetical protein VLB07_13965, partial [Woeseiaceae bacterium]|nr:hypothetical protein [Woeseiaceae bacterium]
MSRLNTHRKSVIAIILIALTAAGCSGSDGADGAPGDDGSAGPPGPPGPPGPSGAVPVTSAEKINVEVTDVDVPAGGGAPTVSISLTNDLDQGLKGMPAANIRFVISQLSPGVNGGSSQWQSYITRSSGGVANAQATTETAAP